MRLPVSTRPQADRVTVKFGKREYEIYNDGIIYATDGRDIPMYVFEYRDWYIKEITA
jgi:hypothetical protein